MTRKYFVLFAAASLAASAAGVQAQNQQAPDQAQLQQQQQPSAVVQPQQQDQNNVSGAAAAGATAAGTQSPYADDVRRVLARVTEQAVKGDVKDVADYFTTNSKDQFSHYGKEARDTGPNATANDDQAKKDAKQADDELKQTAKQFADAWKAKYGHDFNLDRKNEPLVYSGDTFQIMQGDMGTRLQQARPAAGEIGGQADTNRDKNAGAADMNKRMATVMVKESHGAPPLTLTLVNEGTFGNRWHIQPPPGLDYKSLSMNLNHHLQQVVNMKDQWPQDENEAYKSVSHHMLAAIAMPMGTQAAGRQLQQQQQPADLNAAQPAGQLQQPSDQTSQQPQQQGQQNQQNQPSR